MMSRTYKQKKTGGKATTYSCRNNGTCPWCTRNRTISTLRRMGNGRIQMKEIEYIDNNDDGTNCND